MEKENTKISWRVLLFILTKLWYFLTKKKKGGGETQAAWFEPESNKYCCKNSLLTTNKKFLQVSIEALVCSSKYQLKNFQYIGV